MLGFIANLLWEFLHIRFYQAYALGFSGYSLAVFQATLWDVWYVLVVYFALTVIHKDWKWITHMSVLDILIVLIAGFSTAAFVEIRALHLGNWAYAPTMPLLPILGIGLSPFLQLGITSLATYWIAGKMRVQ